MPLMGLGHVLGKGGVAASTMASEVAGDPAVFMKDGDGGGGHADVQFFTPELIGHAVIVTVHLDMVIDVDGRFFSTVRTRRGGQARLPAPVGRWSRKGARGRPSSFVKGAG